MTWLQVPFTEYNYRCVMCDSVEALQLKIPPPIQKEQHCKFCRKTTTWVRRTYHSTIAVMYPDLCFTPEEDI